VLSLNVLPWYSRGCLVHYIRSLYIKFWDPVLHLIISFSFVFCVATFSFSCFSRLSQLYSIPLSSVDLLICVKQI
jgi:hypothetical protein